MTKNNFPAPYRSHSPGRSTILTLAVIAGLAVVTACMLTSFAQNGGDDMKQAPAIDLTKPYSGHLERAMFAGGCFWGTQYSFQKLPGVVKSLVGYAGGKSKNPTYQDVCSHQTGHAETVYIEFDPQKLTYRQLVDYFWTIHDPTTVNRQGPDEGDNYRSVIFYTTPAQKATAEESKAHCEKSGQYHSKIVTQIVPATIFYPAEEYHQNYDIKNGAQGCPIPTGK